jgi:hypothetical protein
VKQEANTWMVCMRGFEVECSVERMEKESRKSGEGMYLYLSGNSRRRLEE